MAILWSFLATTKKKKKENGQEKSNKKYAAFYKKKANTNITCSPNTIQKKRKARK